MRKRKNHDAGFADVTGDPVHRQTFRRLYQMIVRAPDSSFGMVQFGLSSFPPRRDPALAIAAGDPEGAAAAVNVMLSAVDTEICRISGAAPALPG